MAYKRFQNTVMESKMLFPFTVVIAAAAIYLAGLVEGGWWIQTACLVVSVMLMGELNSSNQLLRVVSQSTPSMYLLLVAVAIYLFPDIECSIMQLCMIALWYMLFHCRQHDESPGWVFYGFFCVGLASMVFVPVLWYVPVFWILMATCLRALTARAFFASLLGLITPYWIGGPFILYLQGPDVVLTHFSQLWTFEPLGDWSMLGIQEWMAIGWTTLLTVIGICHYLNSGYQDKIRTRLLHEVFITSALITIAAIALQPQHHKLWLSILIVNASPLIAHYLTLTHTWLTNISYHLIIIITLAIITLNVWKPSLTFLSVMATQACSFLPL
jgi:hypothetical protein